MDYFQFLCLLLRDIIMGIILAWCTISSSFGQNGGPGTLAKSIINSGSIPKVFLQGAVPNYESAPSFSPDGKTLDLSDSRRSVFQKWLTAPMFLPKGKYSIIHKITHLVY
jgi:hypothetical protein